MIRRALRLARGAFGEDHPNYATALNTEGGWYVHAGRRDEARQRFKSALRINRAALGADHPSTRASAANLAQTRDVA